MAEIRVVLPNSRGVKRKWRFCVLFVLFQCQYGALQPTKPGTPDLPSYCSLSSELEEIALYLVKDKNSIFFTVFLCFTSILREFFPELRDDNTGIMRVTAPRQELPQYIVLSTVISRK